MREYLFPLRKITNRFKSINSKEDLQNFIQERSAHVTQTTLYGYLKTRIGTRYTLMLEDEKFAESINLSSTQFNKCLDDRKYKEKVNSMYEFGNQIGIDATPSFLVFNDEKIIKIRGNQPLEVFLKTFDELWCCKYVESILINIRELGQISNG